MEAGALAAKKKIGELQGVAEPPDFEKLSWKKEEGSKGPYEKTSKMANNNSNVFQALQRELKANRGFWKHEGNSYWNHQGDPDVIDRRNSKGSPKQRRTN